MHLNCLENYLHTRSWVINSPNGFAAETWALDPERISVNKRNDFEFEYGGEIVQKAVWRTCEVTNKKN